MNVGTVLIICLGTLSAQAAWIPRVSDEHPLAGPLAYQASIASSRRSVFVAWADSEPGNYTQLGIRIRHTGDTLDREPVVFWPSPFSFQNGHSPLTVASDGSSFFMVRLAGPAYGWFHDGSKRGPGPRVDLPRPTDALYSVTGFGLAGGAPGYVAAWTVARQNPSNPWRMDFVIACVRIDSRGRPLMRNAVILNPNETYSHSAAAACCRDRFLVAWQTGLTLQAAMLHGDTISSPLLPLFGGLSLANLGYPSVIADEDSFVVGGSSGTGFILARFALSGALVQTNHISLGSAGPFALVRLPGRLLAVYTANGQTTNASIRGLQINAELEPEGDSFLIEGQVGWWGRATAVPTRHGETLAVIERNYDYTNSHVFTRRIRFDASAGR